MNSLPIRRSIRHICTPKFLSLSICCIWVFSWEEQLFWDAWRAIMQEYHANKDAFSVKKIVLAMHAIIASTRMQYEIIAYLQSYERLFYTQRPLITLSPLSRNLKREVTWQVEPIALLRIQYRERIASTPDVYHIVVRLKRAPDRCFQRTRNRFSGLAARLEKQLSHFTNVPNSQGVKHKCETLKPDRDIVLFCLLGWHLHSLQSGHVWYQELLCHH